MGHASDLFRPLSALAALLGWSAVALAQNNSVTVTPASVSLSYTLQSEKVPTGTVMVGTTTGQPVQAVVSVLNTGTPSGFLAVTPGSCPATPCTLTVAATSAQAISTVLDKLKPGTYTASFQVLGVPRDTSTSVNPSPPVNVTLTVQAAAVPLLTASPSSVTLVAQAGTATPATATINVSLNPAATSASRPFGDAASSSPRAATLTVPVDFDAGVTGSGLSLREALGTVPGEGSFEVHVSLNPVGLPKGNSSGVLTLTPTGVSNTTPTTVPIIVNLVDTNVLTRSQSSFTFQVQKGGEQTLPQELTVTSGSPLASVTATASTGSTGGTCGNWFNVIAGLPSPGEARIIASPNNDALSSAPGATCGGFITVQATDVNGGVTAFTIPVQANIGSKPFLQANPPTLTSKYNPNSFFKSSGTGSFITSTGANLSFSASNTLPWAPVSPASGATPESILALPVSPVPSGLADGIYADTVSVTAPGAANTLSLPLEVEVAAQPRIKVNPAALTIFGAAGDTVPVLGELEVSASGGSVNFTVQSNFAGLNFPSQTFTAPQAGSTVLPFSLDLSKLAPGPQTGSLTLTPPVGSPVNVPVTVTATSGPSALVTPRVFNAVLDPASGPVDEVVNISGPKGSDYRSSDGGITWADLTVRDIETPAGTSAPAATAVVIDPAGITPGTTNVGSIIFTQPGGVILTVPIAATAGNGSIRPITVDTRVVPLYLQVGQSSRSSFSVGLGSSTGSDKFTAHSDFLDLVGPGSLATYQLAARDAASAGSKATLSISIDPKAVSAWSPGAYRGEVTIVGSAPGDIPVTLPISLVIGTAPPVAVVNAASGQTGAVSPGEIISIFGSNIGPATPAGLTLTPTGTVSTTLGNTQVFFDNIPAALTYAGSGQINAVVPYEMGGRLSTYVTVRQNGTTTGAANLAVTDSVPSIFSLQGGTGQGAILNQDGTVNAASNPAPAGSAIVLYGTGEGPLAPAAATASVTSSTGPTFPAPVLPVTVTIGGQPAAIAYAGEAPGFVSGVLQVNAVIPTGLGSGPQQVVVTVGNVNNSAQNITVAVK